MSKKLTMFSLSFSIFSFVPTIFINHVDTITNNIHYSEAIEKVNSTRMNIENAIETLTKISNGIDQRNDALNDQVDGATKFDSFLEENPFVAYKNESFSGGYYDHWSLSWPIVTAPVYSFYGEFIILKPHYVTKVSAISHYVITSSSWYSWNDMETWFKDKSANIHEIRKNYGTDKFYISDLDKDVEPGEGIKITGTIKPDKPSATIYLGIKIESSEKSSPILNDKVNMGSHVGWALFDAELLHGRIMFSLTKPSIARLDCIKQKINDFKNEMSSNISRLNAYNPAFDHAVEYENSNLKRILNDCEQAYKKANDFINLSRTNRWIAKHQITN